MKQTNKKRNTCHPHIGNGPSFTYEMIGIFKTLGLFSKWHSQFTEYFCPCIFFFKLPYGKHRAVRNFCVQ